ncbi:MAG: threonine/serine exporter family protein [Bacteroidales bacterium]|nr:threonine/serine exporter family protein [Bacteroidales bacterium]
MTETEIKQVLDVAYEAGNILLENGAEIARVEETTARIAAHFGVDDSSFFVLSNGIFATARGYAQVRFIPFKGAQLSRVVAVNQLSRDIEAGQYTLDEVAHRLADIRSMPPMPAIEQIAASGLGSAAFCIIFGGGWMDCVASFVAGALLYVFVCFVSAPYMSKLMGNICGGALVTLLCMFFHRMGLGCSLGNMIIGAIIPLIPGVPFTNGVRDLANEDYIAGTTRLLDALLVFFCIALGVCLVFLIDSHISGSMLQLSGMSISPGTSPFGIQTMAAFLGTVAFAILFGVPHRYALSCGLCGMIGWMLYMVLNRYFSFSPAEATFFATLLVAFAAHYSAIWRRCPVTVFLICGIFPLIPGAGIFWTSYFIVSSQHTAALATGFTALKVAVAIVLGIISLFEIMQHLPGRRKV